MARGCRLDLGTSDRFPVHRCRQADRWYVPTGTYRRQSQQCLPRSRSQPSPKLALQRERNHAMLAGDERPSNVAQQQLPTLIETMDSMLSDRCDQCDYRRARSRWPLSCQLNREGVGAGVACVCRVFKRGFVKLCQHSISRPLHNARTGYWRLLS